MGPNSKFQTIFTLLIFAALLLILLSIVPARVLKTISRDLALTTLLPTRHHLYIVANNKDLRKWSPNFSPSDIFFFFNTAPLLSKAPGLRDIPKNQVILFLRQKNSTSFHGVPQLDWNELRAQRVVFVVNPRWAEHRDVQVTSLPHMFLRWNIVPDYPKGSIPSTGFVAYVYAKKHYHDCRINLVGFTGEGHFSGHGWDYEQQILHSDPEVCHIDKF